MNVQEYGNYRAVAEMARRARRENDRLREQLGQQTEARREQDRQDQEAQGITLESLDEMAGCYGEDF